MDIEDFAIAPFSDVARRFGYYCDRAIVRPVVIERDGAARVVMMSASEYERLARLDHVALLPSELDQADIAALRDAVVTVRQRPSG